MKSELVTPAHRARRAVVCIRQSTPAQVMSQESLRLQYALEGRARELGWRAADVGVTCADLGQSGASASGREGGRGTSPPASARSGSGGEVGLVPSIVAPEARFRRDTRLARNCTDWYPLLDVRALRDCLIADRDGVYDPGAPNGRLLLGLEGPTSELEPHTIRARLTTGLLAKARRGELALTLPVGLTRVAGDVVQDRLGLVFATFARRRSAAAVMRDLVARSLDPARAETGTARLARGTRAALAAATTILREARPCRRERPRAQADGGRGRTRRGGSQALEGATGPGGLAHRGEGPLPPPPSIGGPSSRTKTSSPTTGRRAWPRRPGARRAREIRCCRASPAAPAAATGCSSAIRAAASASCRHLRARAGACRPARPCAPRPSTPPWANPSSPRSRRRSSTRWGARIGCGARPRTPPLAAARQRVERRGQAGPGPAPARQGRSRPSARGGRVGAALGSGAHRAARGRGHPGTARGGHRRARGPGPGPAVAGSSRSPLRLPAPWSDPATGDDRRKALLRCLVEKVALERGAHDTAQLRVVWRVGAVSELSVLRPVPASPR